MQIIVIDARNMCYKFGYVGKDLTSSTGERTGAIHGVLMGMSALKRHYPDAKFVVVWDGMDTNHTWRVGVFPEYKAARREPPSPEQAQLRASVLKQIVLIQQMLQAVGVVQIEVPRLEADDVIGILSEKLTARGWPVTVYSSDQDYLQLIPFGVMVITSASAMPVSAQAVQYKWKCQPEDLLKLRALLGDTSDGIPRAVSGVGPVAAAKYIALGVDPSVPNFDGLPRTVREQAERLRPSWPKIHQNWRLMKILRSCHDPDFPKELAGPVTVETRRVLRELAGPVDRDTALYERMLSQMAALDLHQAIANRREIWNLQTTSLEKEGRVV